MALVASIAASRANGIAPLGVFFDATGTTSDATTLEFHECYYKWDFGDTGSGTFAYGNPTLNSRNTAKGPLAAHVFETAGTYTVTLTVYDDAGLVDTETTTITVYDPTDAVNGYTTIVAVSTSGNFTGKPAGATEVTSSDFDAVLTSHWAAGTLIVFRGGETFAAGTMSNSAITSPWGIGSYSGFGTGRPIISSTVGSNPTIFLGNGTVDGRIYGFEFNGNSTAGSHLVQTNTNCDRVTILNIDGHDAAGLAIFFTNDNKTQEIFLHDCVSDANVGATANVVRIDGDMYSVQGCLFDKSGNAESPLRTGYWTKSIVQHNKFVGNAASHEQFALRGPTGTVCQYFICSDNEFEPDGSSSLNIGPSNTTVDCDMQDVLIERNFFNVDAGGSPNVACLALTRASIRNNLHDGSGGSGAFNMVQFTEIGSNVCGSSTDIWIYANTGYNSSATTNNYIAQFGGASATEVTRVEVKNNLAYCPNGTNRLVTSTTDDDITAANNSATEPAANGMGDDPSFVGSNGDGTGTFTVPNDFRILAASYGVTAGAADLPVFEDYFGNVRNRASLDMGFYAYTQGTLPSPIALGSLGGLG